MQIKKIWFLVMLILFSGSYVLAQSNEDCLICHEAQEAEEGEPLLLEEGDPPGISLSGFQKSVHADFACVDCHPDGTEEHDAGGQEVEKQPCADCHDQVAEIFSQSIHGKLHAEADPAAPSCSDCHDPHVVRNKKDLKSVIHPFNIPKVCGKCHQDGEKGAIRKNSSQTEIIKNYGMSIHGKGLLKSGLLVSANCVSCHTAHNERPKTDPESTVHPENIAKTCGNCHLGIYEKFANSIHSPNLSKTDAKLPVCNDCHSSHQISRTGISGFRKDILTQCGGCHEKLSKSYFNTYHGKVSRLGLSGAAKCHDCHGSHVILPTDHEASTLSSENIVETCQNCHPNANENFVTFLPHAKNSEKEKHPELFYVFWGMTALLLVTFSLFGLHTLLWLVRSLSEKMEQNKNKAKETEYVYVRRFNPQQSLMHLVVIISFLSLAVTGLALKFSETDFFSMVSRLFGGPESMGMVHRIFAVVTFGYALVHLIQLYFKRQRKEISFKGLFSEEYTLVPLKRDLVELVQNIKWFLWMGPKPKFGRWTYWEKFDYLAVFWGVAVIGASGLILWFPEWFTNWMPGWFINVATIIHSDEAILAVGFIFTIHFFNTHFRPEKFPMDPVIFTGKMPLSEFKEERSREFETKLESGEIDLLRTDPPPTWFLKLVYVGGLTFLGIGMLIILAILYSLFTLL